MHSKTALLFKLVEIFLQNVWFWMKNAFSAMQNFDEEILRMF